jgi:hypothetical protein
MYHVLGTILYLSFFDNAQILSGTGPDLKSFETSFAWGRKRLYTSSGSAPPGSGSFHQQEEKLRKTLDSNCFVTSE